VTSRSDYSEIARGMGVKYVSLSDTDAFLGEGLDVIVFATSILSFESLLQSFAPSIQKDLDRQAEMGEVRHGPLVVDVLSVKEHARQVMLDVLPPECDILCSHPMFGPDSGKDGWQVSTLFTKALINKMGTHSVRRMIQALSTGRIHSIHEEVMPTLRVDRMERSCPSGKKKDVVWFP
jgi:prephenate dehydrogenase